MGLVGPGLRACRTRASTEINKHRMDIAFEPAQKRLQSAILRRKRGTRSPASNRSPKIWSGTSGKFARVPLCWYPTPAERPPPARADVAERRTRGCTGRQRGQARPLASTHGKGIIDNSHLWSFVASPGPTSYHATGASRLGGCECAAAKLRRAEGSVATPVEYR